MWGGRADVPFEADASSRILPFIIALMVFLATLAIAATAALNGSITRWNQGLQGKLTVQIEAPLSASEGVEASARVDAALDILLSTPGIEGAAELSRAEIEGLLDPWLGKGNLSPGLPVPTLIDVTLAPGAAPDLADLSRRLAAAVPGAELDDHKLWLGKLVRLARSVQVIAALVVVLISLSAVAVIVFATRADLAAHHDIVEVLHLIGAHDFYIARQFQGQALALGLRGGVLGLVLALATFFAIAELAGELEAPLLPRLELDLTGWIAVGALPLVSALIATLTARVTVVRTLRRIL